jgi:predicted amidohydrolase
MTMGKQNTATGERTAAADRVIAVRCHELAPVIGDLAANVALIDAAIADAMACGVRLLVLPELATSGYHLTPAEAAACALTPDADPFVRWAALMNPEAVLVLGFAEADGDRVFNSAAVVTRDGVQAVHRKTHL